MKVVKDAGNHARFTARNAAPSDEDAREYHIIFPHITSSPSKIEISSPGDITHRCD
jgi:hypothetical protein